MAYMQQSRTGAIAAADRTVTRWSVAARGVCAGPQQLEPLTDLEGTREPMVSETEAATATESIDRSYSRK